MQRTDLVFQRDAHLAQMQAVVLAVNPYSSLAQVEKDLFKQATEKSYVVITAATIFHPQGGGQPSDIGIMQSEAGAQFEMLSARTSNLSSEIVFHFGHFLDSEKIFSVSETVTQSIDEEKRLLFSRYHTAGHILGAAVRDIVSGHVKGLEKLKASHIPSMAACEYHGSIEGKWKDAIQARVDEIIDADYPVTAKWWDDEEFRLNGLEDALPDRKALGVPDDEKFRVIEIGPADTYPCGGTHVDSSKECGKTTVKKISRSKGTSRIGYSLAE
ncbi:ThrRS/AlaRS common domain-containing protein [Dissoconium aciculare CBS 342.82]|uniref:ThrRS/AlaRS common domain-containing protein n=1 Tax=Dissoconium aciculare CBS 342.82 TaxID=1314786 RepID=A0A6J3MH04_9PEZI|nr:ThrRS/AlaRS common domain-containing protein [Dissoconium aciculare CBS 342.82]KAF1827236.1 ThrRS/AlaRS common domain-containing protein [Dissoconium aciculare CBS 342.82]